MSEDERIEYETHVHAIDFTAVLQTQARASRYRNPRIVLMDASLRQPVRSRAGKHCNLHKDPNLTGIDYERANWCGCAALGERFIPC